MYFDRDLLTKPCKTHGKDIMLICKGWYDDEKYKTLKDALLTYYHKNYGCEDIDLDYDGINQILLKPAIEELLTERNHSHFINCMFNTDIGDFWKYDINHINIIKLEYEEELYYRLTKFLRGMQVSNGDGCIYINTSSYFKTIREEKVLKEKII